MISSISPACVPQAKYDGIDGEVIGRAAPAGSLCRPDPDADGAGIDRRAPGFMDYTDDPVMRERGLMESEGIGWSFAGQAHADGAGKNEAAVESAAASRERLEAGAQGIIAILIGL